MKKVFLALILCWPVWVWAATYYIDPDCENNGDGTTQDCASSGGGTGAYNTAPSLSDGNVYSWKAGTTDTLSAEIGGAISTVTLNAYGSGARPIIDGSGISATSRTVRINGAAWTIDGIHIIAPTAGSTGNAINIGSLGDTITVQNTTIEGQGTDATATSAAGILTFQTTDYTLKDIDCTNFNVCIRAAPALWSGTAVIDGLNCYALSGNDDEAQDCITIQGNIDYSYTLTIKNSEFQGFREQGVDLGAASHVYVLDNSCHDGIYAGASVRPVCYAIGDTGNNATGNYLIRNKCYDNPDGYCAQSRGAVDSFMIANIGWNLLEGITNNIAGSNGNAYYNNAIHSTSYAWSAVNGTTGLIARNNIFRTENANTGVLCDTSSTCTGDHNSFSGTAEYNGDGTWTNAGDDITADPLLIGGTNPTTAEGFNTRKGSPLRAAGTIVGQRTDYNGRPFKFPPSIGAMETNSGDEAEERTLRYD